MPTMDEVERGSAAFARGVGEAITKFLDDEQRGKVMTFLTGYARSPVPPARDAEGYAAASYGSYLVLIAETAMENALKGDDRA